MSSLIMGRSSLNEDKPENTPEYIARREAEVNEYSGEPLMLTVINGHEYWRTAYHRRPTEELRPKPTLSYPWDEKAMDAATARIIENIERDKLERGES